MKPYQETILYLQSLIVILESLQNGNPTDKEYSKTQLGILNDVSKNISKLIKFVDIKQVSN
tara:strand:+ start:2533 stop:2715 length:183 start_codon:yes stop_codon:yes gene_type:complete